MRGVGAAAAVSQAVTWISTMQAAMEAQGAIALKDLVLPEGPELENALAEIKCQVWFCREVRESPMKRKRANKQNFKQHTHTHTHANTDALTHTCTHTCTHAQRVSEKAMQGWSAKCPRDLIREVHYVTSVDNLVLNLLCLHVVAMVSWANDILSSSSAIWLSKCFHVHIQEKCLLWMVDSNCWLQAWHDEQSTVEGDVSVESPWLQVIAANPEEDERTVLESNSHAELAAATSDETEQERADLPPLEWGGEVLTQQVGKRIARLAAAVDGFHAKTVLARVHAAAEATRQAQDSCLASLFEYVEKLCSLRQMKPHCFIEHVLYDESPLVCRVYYNNDRAETETARVMMVERGWTLVLERLNFDSGPSKFLVLEACETPSLRASQTETGESIAAVLQSCSPPPLKASSLFPLCVRLCETDEGPSNPRGEALLLEQRNAEGANPWAHLYSFCLAHKCHASAVKTWMLQEKTLAGAIHASKCLTAAGAMRSLRESIEKLLPQRFRVLRTEEVSLDPAGVAFKENVLQHFLPPSTQPRRRAAVIAGTTFFGGDWRTPGELVHVCEGERCCNTSGGFKFSVTKAVKLFKSLVTALRPNIFAKNNWMAWMSSLRLFAIGTAMNSFLIDVFHDAFAKHTKLESREDVCDVNVLGMGDSSHALEWLVPPNLVDMAPTDMPQRDPNAIFREENARSLRVALDFMQPGVYKSVCLFALPLAPERQLMSFFCHSVSREWECEQQRSLWLTGARRYRALELHLGNILPDFFRQSFDIFANSMLWENFEPTEAFRSELLKYSMRSACIVHQLIRLKVTGFPFKLLVLLNRNDAELEQKASTLLATPPCMRDDFSQKFLQHFPDVASLCSLAAFHILSALARRLMLTTFTTEKLHSRNLRRAKARVVTSRMNIKDLALHHSAFVGPPFLQPPSAISSAK
eukprot:5801731-Amphidinium_carterae.1